MESKKSCYYCTNKKEVDFKEVEILQRFINFDNKIETRKRTRLCAKHQRKASKAIKTARQFGLLK